MSPGRRYSILVAVGPRQDIFGQSPGTTGLGAEPIRPPSSTPTLPAAAANASAVLTGYAGIVQCDGYTAYKQFADPTRDGGPITLAFCLPHWRRRFFDIDQAGPAPSAHEALERIAALYAIESRVRGRSAEERHSVRQAGTKPLVE